MDNDSPLERKGRRVVSLVPYEVHRERELRRQEVLSLVSLEKESVSWLHSSIRIVWDEGATSRAMPHVSLSRDITKLSSLKTIDIRTSRGC